MKYRTQTANVLNEADRSERIIRWQEFQMEQERVLYWTNEKSDWVPGDPLYHHPRTIVANMWGFYDEGPVGNHVRPMFELFDDGEKYQRMACPDCEVWWPGYETNTCWMCGEVCDRNSLRNIFESFGLPMYTRDEYRQLLGYSLPPEAARGATTTVSVDIPSNPEVGDIWVDADDNYQMHRWSGDVWQLVDSGRSEITFFDDYDIDYNEHRFRAEQRVQFPEPRTIWREQRIRRDDLVAGGQDVVNVIQQELARRLAEEYMNQQYQDLFQPYSIQVPRGGMRWRGLTSVEPEPPSVPEGMRRIEALGVELLIPADANLSGRSEIELPPPPRPVRDFSDHELVPFRLNITQQRRPHR